MEAEPSTPNPTRTFYETQTMHLFDCLVYNDDRNPSNVLYDPQWKLWMIDATRAFQATPELKDQERVYRCERGLWNRIQHLDETEVREKLEDTGLLTSEQVRALMKRHEKLVKHIQDLIDAKGEDAVLFDF